jgi:hypothetical protein
MLRRPRPCNCHSTSDEWRRVQSSLPHPQSGSVARNTPPIGMERVFDASSRLTKSAGERCHIVGTVRRRWMRLCSAVRRKSQPVRFAVSFSAFRWTSGPFVRAARQRAVANRGRIEKTVEK